MTLFTKPKVVIGILTVIIVLEAVVTLKRFSISLNLEKRYIAPEEISFKSYILGTTLHMYRM
jgi:hypothetical protein